MLAARTKGMIVQRWFEGLSPGMDYIVDRLINIKVKIEWRIEQWLDEFLQPGLEFPIEPIGHVFARRFRDIGDRRHRGFDLCADGIEPMVELFLPIVHEGCLNHSMPFIIATACARLRGY